MTLAEQLHQAESQLHTGLHRERARRDAETLLLHHIGKNRAWLLAHLGDNFGGCSAIGYAALIDRRRRGEPIQYITGEAEFYGLPFFVTPDVLIPRPETEHLVERVIQLVGAPSDRLGCPIHAQSYRAWVGKHERGQSTTCSILDVGAGSGAIAVALAHELPTAQITATDISERALAIARQNSERNAVADRIRFLPGDLLAPVAGEVFDIIVSNPPYVSTTDRNLLSVEVRDYEPELALFAGNDGLDIYRRLIPSAFAPLVPGGFLLLEIGYGQQPAIRDLLASAGYRNIDFHPDLQNIPRVAVAQHP